MALNPTLSGEKSYGEKKRRTRSDRKMRVRLYMDSQQKDKLKDLAESKGFTMTSYVSDIIRQVSKLAHRYDIEVQEIPTQEDYIHIKLSVEEHLYLRKHSQMNKVTIEQSCFSWFEYSKLSHTKKRTDERAYIVAQEEEDSFPEVVIKDYTSHEDGGLIW